MMIWLLILSTLSNIKLHLFSAIAKIFKRCSLLHERRLFLLKACPDGGVTSGKNPYVMYRHVTTRHQMSRHQSYAIEIW